MNDNKKIKNKPTTIITNTHTQKHTTIKKTTIFVLKTLNMSTAYNMHIGNLHSKAQSHLLDIYAHFKSKTPQGHRYWALRNIGEFHGESTCSCNVVADKPRLRS